MNINNKIQQRNKLEKTRSIYLAVLKEQPPKDHVSLEYERICEEIDELNREIQEITGQRPTLGL